MRRQNHPSAAPGPTVTQQFVGVAPDIIFMIGVTRPRPLFCQTARRRQDENRRLLPGTWLQCDLPCEPLVTDASQPRIVYVHPKRVPAIEGDKPARCRAMRASPSLWRLDDRDEFDGELLRSAFRVALGMLTRWRASHTACRRGREVCTPAQVRTTAAYAVSP